MTDFDSARLESLEQGHQDWHLNKQWQKAEEVLTPFLPIEFRISDMRVRLSNPSRVPAGFLSLKVAESPAFCAEVIVAGKLARGMVGIRVKRR